MDLSVVVITKDEAPRLRLTLEALAHQRAASDVAWEIVVVDDGSSDDTARVLAEASLPVPLRVITNAKNIGRSASRNAGARAAAGARLLFLDGDILLAPDAVERHARLDRTAMGRGETHHLRCTRFFHDPEACTPMPGQELRVERMANELDKHRVTRAQIRTSWDDIAARGEPGIYPGAGPRKLYELEMRALTTRPELDILWMAASGHNFSVPRAEFLSEEGFAPEITINEHRELAVRLQKHGLRVVPVAARSYHMTHRVGWRDPISDPEWEQQFYLRHPVPATKLMSIFWQSISDDKHVTPDARIDSLEQLDEIVRGGDFERFDAVRRNHPQLRVLTEPS